MRIIHLGDIFFVEALRRLGHEVFSVALHGGDCNISSPVAAMRLYADVCAQGFRPDMTIYCDNGNLPLVLGVEDLPCLTFFYSVDTYCNDWHMPYMHLFDHCFVAQKGYAALAAQDTGGRAEWLPLFANESLLRATGHSPQQEATASAGNNKTQASSDAVQTAAGNASCGCGATSMTNAVQTAAGKAFCRCGATTMANVHPSTTEAWLAARDLPAVFVGTKEPRNNAQRLPFLHNFQRLHPLDIIQGAFVPPFSRARIVLNQSASEEVNFRCFEAMACGAALLTEASPHGLNELFHPGEDILPVYARGNAVEAAAIAKVALHQPHELAELALRGQKLVWEHHLDTHRAALLLERAAALLGSGLPEQRLRERARCQAFARAAYGMIALDMRDPALATQRECFLQLAVEA